MDSGTNERRSCDLMNPDLPCSSDKQIRVSGEEDEVKHPSCLVPVIQAFGEVLLSGDIRCPKNEVS